MAPYKAPSGKVAAILPYVKDTRRDDVTSYNKRVSKSRGTDSKVFTKDGRDYCDESIGYFGSNLMVNSKGAGINLRRFYCLNASNAKNPDNDFPDESLSGDKITSKVVCPGANRAFWDDDLNLVCEYNEDDITEDNVQALYRTAEKSRVAKDVHDVVIKSFCNDARNLNKTINNKGETCKDMIDVYDLDVIINDPEPEEPVVANTRVVSVFDANAERLGINTTEATDAEEADVDIDTTEATDAEEAEEKNNKKDKKKKKKKNKQDETDDADDGADEDADDDDETDDEEDLSAILAAAARAKAAREKEEADKKAAEQQQLFALILLVVLLLCSSSAAAAFFMFKQ